MRKLSDLLLGRLVDRRIAAFQKDLLTKHCAEVENIYRQMRGWRHDYHNHIQTMLALSEQPEQLRAYLFALNQDLKEVDTVLKTGNVMVDAILNSKLSLIRSGEIEVHAKAAVPESLQVSDVDLCVILGNLLDNAMEACLHQETGTKRFIRVYMGVLKGQLYINVTNSTGHDMRRPTGRYRSEKKEAGHGFGLFRVDRIAMRYDGYVNRQNEPGVFVTEVMLPL